MSNFKLLWAFKYCSFADYKLIEQVLSRNISGFSSSDFLGLTRDNFNCTGFKKSEILNLVKFLDAQNVIDSNGSLLSLKLLVVIDESASDTDFVMYSYNKILSKFGFKINDKQSVKAKKQERQIVDVEVDSFSYGSKEESSYDSEYTSSNRKRRP